MTKAIAIKKEQVLSDFLAELRAAAVETRFSLSQAVLRLLHSTACSIVQVRELLAGQMEVGEIIALASKEIGFSPRYIYRAIELLEFVPDVENLPKGFDNKTVSFNKLATHFLGEDKTKKEKAKKDITCPKCGYTF